MATAKESRFTIGVSWFVALVLCGASGAGLYTIFVPRAAEATPLWVTIVLAVMGLLGLVLLREAVRQSVEWARFGALSIETVGEAMVGGSYAARLYLPAAARPAEALETEFACVHTRWQKTRNRKSSNRIDTDLHREKRAFPIRWTGGRGRVEIRFAIPPGLPASASEEPVDDDAEEAPPERGFHHWEMKIHVAAGGGLWRSYTVKVRPAQA